MEYLLILGRLVSIMPFVLVLTLITGRRKMGELPVFDYIVIITLGSVIGADIAEPEIPHLPTAYAIAILIGMQYLYSVIIMKNRKLERLLTFEPVVVIANGQFVKANLKKTKYTIDNVLMMLRDKDVFDLNEVEFAIIESTGQVSVLKKAQYQPVTVNEMKLNTEYKGLAVPLIVEGKVYEDNLIKLNLTKEWLISALKEKNINSVEAVFYAAMNEGGQIYISIGIEDTRGLKPIRN